jgi:hypothetical protein
MRRRQEQKNRGGKLQDFQGEVHDGPFPGGNTPS